MLKELRSPVFKARGRIGVARGKALSAKRLTRAFRFESPPGLPEDARVMRVSTSARSGRSATAAPDPRTTAVRVAGHCPLRPTLGIVLGSGFQDVATRLEVAADIPYAALPGFSPAGVSGHAGRLLLGQLSGAPTALLCGRAHFYEGHSMEAVTFPVRVLAALGVRNLVLTNAAGGINPRFQPGDFMLISDHINLMPAHPLRGAGVAGGERFVDLSRAYDARLRRCLLSAGRKLGLRLRQGVYLAVPGPSYETPAEIRAFARLGADAVGMSTVPEVIVARQCGLAVAGLSCITNLAAGRSPGPLSHAEVLATGERVRRTAMDLLSTFAELARVGGSTLGG
jgi:purine-nucleoside phosphorylase